MAVITATAAQQNWSTDLGRNQITSLFLAAAFPIVLFVAANYAGEIFAVQPRFFAPFGLPGWLGGVFHVAMLPLFGVGGWMAWRQGGEGRAAAAWTAVLALGSVAYPFVVLSLDSLMLSIVSIALTLVGLSAITRIAKVSPLAALIMSPGLLWIGFSAFLGLSLVASWSPPFGITNGSHGAAAV